MLPRGGLRESPNMDYSACNSCQRTEGRLILSCPSLRALLCLWKRPRAPRRKLVERWEGVLSLHTLSFFFRWKRVPVCNLCNDSQREDNPSLSVFWGGGGWGSHLCSSSFGFFFFLSYLVFFLSRDINTHHCISGLHIQYTVSREGSRVLSPSFTLCESVCAHWQVCVCVRAGASL